MKVGREDGDEQGDKPPRCGASKSRDENCDSPCDLRSATQEIQRARKREIRRDHGQICLRIQEMVNARHDEKCGEQDY